MNTDAEKDLAAARIEIRGLRHLVASLEATIFRLRDGLGARETEDFPEFVERLAKESDTWHELALQLALRSLDWRVSFRAMERRAQAAEKELAQVRDELKACTESRDSALQLLRVAMRRFEAKPIVRWMLQAQKLLGK